MADLTFIRLKFCHSKTKNWNLRLFRRRDTAACTAPPKEANLSTEILRSRRFIDVVSCEDLIDSEASAIT